MTSRVSRIRHAVDGITSRLTAPLVSSDGAPTALPLPPDGINRTRRPWGLKAGFAPAASRAATAHAGATDEQATAAGPATTATPSYDDSRLAAPQRIINIWLVLVTATTLYTPPLRGVKMSRPPGQRRRGPRQKR